MGVLFVYFFGSFNNLLLHCSWDWTA